MIIWLVWTFKIYSTLDLAQLNLSFTQPVSKKGLVYFCSVNTHQILANTIHQKFFLKPASFVSEEAGSTWLLGKFCFWLLRDKSEIVSADYENMGIWYSFAFRLSIHFYGFPQSSFRIRMAVS